MAGAPDMRRSMEIALACLDGGADVLEVGIPFSDPVADGPVIQEAGAKALEGGTTPLKVLEMVAELRTRTDRPLVLMGYYNPIFRRGEERFVREAVTAGADGLIVPDLPLHEGAGLRAICMREGLPLVQLCTPLTPPERQRKLMEATSGFLYLVTRTGVTGGGGFAADQLEGMVRRGREIDPSMPLAAGFGISRPDQVREARALGVDGVIVGSALVTLALSGAGAEAVREKVRQLAEAGREGTMQ
jgi:tryptophan synthase alpha chain